MLTARIESLLNRQVAASPRAAELVAALAGHSMRVAVSHTPWAWTLASDGHALRLSRDASGAAPGSVDATIRGTPLSLLAMFAGEHLCRQLVLPPADRASIADTIRAFRAGKQRQAPSSDPQ